MYTTPSQSRIKVLATPGFLAEAEKHGSLGVVKEPLKILTEALEKCPAEPSWVVVEPALKEPQDDDEGRTRRLPGPFRYWAIRDDHPADCECGCGGKSVVSFILPEEY